jgi:hypothetical protein
MNVYRIIMTVMTLMAVSDVWGQKVSASVKVFREKLQGRNLDLFEGFEQKLTDYINNYDWSKTGDNTPLNLDIQIVIEKASDEGENRFVTATLYITNGKELQFLDDNCRFSLRKGATFNHDPNTIDSFLSIIDFYIQIMLGDEMDTLGRFLGTSFFQSARSIAAQAKVQHGGWDDRIQRIDQFFDTRYQDYRVMKDFYYEGISLFDEGDMTGARKNLIRAVEYMEKLLDHVITKNHTERFIQVHYLDICKVFEGSREKSVFDRLMAIDPKNKDTYQRYKQNR